MGEPNATNGTVRTKRARSGGAVLIVDDDRAAGEVLVEALRHRRFSAQWVGSAGEAMAALATGEAFDVVLTDLRMPGANGLALVTAVAGDHPLVPVVVITAFGSIRTAVDAIQHGAYDFLTKPYDLELVALSLDRAVEHRRALLELERLRAEREPADDGIITRSPLMQRVLATLKRVAETDASVLVHGESGTGKELVARAIHRRSPRAGKPFVAVNCAALPEQLLESELFGHAKGAFTDARSSRPGLFARAHGGTIFLDEIGDMPASMQSKLLRVLEERTIRPVGADSEVATDVRVVAATNRDLEADVASGRFREDLYFRVQAIELPLPPLRVRGGDVLLLAHEFLRRSAERTGRPVVQLSPAAAQRLSAYEWPGNVRELQNCMERALAMSDGAVLRETDLPERVRAPEALRAGFAVDDAGGLVSLEEIERRYILHAMRALDGNKRVAAQVLGLDRSTLYRKLELYGEHERKRDEQKRDEQKRDEQKRDEQKRDEQK